MRIISGHLKGLKLLLPKDKKTRPLRDMVKENIFNLLTHSKKISSTITKSNVLDLYSGTGSFGLECLSRGASNVTFVENGDQILVTLKKNISNSNFKNETKIFCEDVLNFVKNYSNLKQKFDLIFCDTPFKESNVNTILKLIFENKLLEKNGILILHRHKSANQKFLDNFKIIEERTYGLSKIIFYKLLF